MKSLYFDIILSHIARPYTHAQFVRHQSCKVQAWRQTGTPLYNYSPESTQFSLTQPQQRILMQSEAQK